MMNKEFISYEQALALKELGFDEPCFRFYSERYTIDSKTGGDIKMGEFYLTDTPRQKTIRCSAPLYQQAFRWFRDKHGLGHMISGIGCETFLVYLINKNGIITITNAKTYEEAEQACLDKLIEIVKNK
jgi:hypothetical protein